MTDIDINLQWHSPDLVWAAVFVRDGQPWYLDGALVGMDSRPQDAVSDLLGQADHLVREGENFLTNGLISAEDRVWLYRLLDQGNDVYGRQARYEAMRAAGLLLVGPQVVGYTGTYPAHPGGTDADS